MTLSRADLLLRAIEMTDCPFCDSHLGLHSVLVEVVCLHCDRPPDACSARFTHCGSCGGASTNDCHCDICGASLR